MKVSFEKTDRLIELMVDSSIILNELYYKGAYEEKHNDNAVFRNLYTELVEITKSDISEDKKHLKRVETFEKAYNLDGEGMLKSAFDEERFVKYLTKAYWQLPSMWGKITDTTGNNFTDKEGLKRFIEKYHPNEPCIDIIAEVVSNQEPTIKDIEKEFWENCPDVDKIDQWCDIYWERFKDHLKIYEDDYYEHAMDGTDKNNLLYQYFQDLRFTGLLKTDRRFVEVRLYHIVENLNYVANGLSELFQGFRRLGQRAKTQSNLHAEFFEALSKYVQGLNLQEFNNILVHKSLSPGYPKAIWNGSKADAIRFTDAALDMKIAAFNSCFSFKDGTALKSNNRDKDGTQSPLDEILSKYCKNFRHIPTYMKPLL